MVEGVALEGVNVVVRGAINPAILTPQWLLAQGIVGQADFDLQEVEVISREFVSFNLGWLNCTGTLDSMQFGTTDPDELMRVRDVAVRTLELLNHTPIATLGVNRYFHSTTESVAKFHAIGDTFAPKRLWEGVLALPGMRDVSIQAVRPDLYSGYVQVAVQPSAQIAGAVFVIQNDHYELTRVESQPTSRTDNWTFSSGSDATSDKNLVAIEILRDRFEDSLVRAEDVRQLVMSAGEL